MGTNFYWHDDALVCMNACDHCAADAVIHVGKRSAGWSFGFRAWTEDSLFEFEIRSRADWRKVFTDRAGSLVDEYGRVEEDPVAWLEALQPPDAVQINWENAQRSGWDSSFYSKHFADREWRDSDGFHFGAYEFS